MDQKIADVAEISLQSAIYSKDIAIADQRCLITKCRGWRLVYR